MQKKNKMVRFFSELPTTCSRWSGGFWSKTIFFPADIAQASPGVPPVIFNMPNFFVKEQFYADFFYKKMEFISLPIEEGVFFLYVW